MSTARGFPESEFSGRVSKAQAMMEQAGLSALLLTTEPDVRYFSGYLTRFWESPTRPWFLVVPSEGKPIAVIPSIGEALMRKTWLDDIRTWRSPDYEDDGISLLAETLGECVSERGKIGIPSHNGTHVRMPLADLHHLQSLLGTRAITHDARIVEKLRMVKSDAEVSKIRTACQIANRAFGRVPEIARPGVPLSRVFRQFQMLCLEEGADWVPYLAGGAEAGGYGDVISPASDDPLCVGDVLMLDTGLVHDGYFCDFDRNFSLGDPGSKVCDAHSRLIEATHAAFEIARPGNTAADIFHVMDRIVTGGVGGSDAGRLGHGLGMQLTEPPSLIAADQTILRSGMVLTLEPGIDLGQGRILVHEENIVVRESGAEWLSDPYLSSMTLVGE